MIEIWNGQSDLKPLAQAWAEEIGVDADMSCVVEDLALMLNDPDSDVIINRFNVIIYGAMGITVQNVSHTKELHSAVRYFYILPERRHLARGMIVFAKKWSREKGCVKMMICESKLSLPCGDFYKAVGFTEYETVYIGDL